MTSAGPAIVVATGNPGKLREIRQVLDGPGIEVLGLGDFSPVAEPQETGATFAENARDKARYYSRALGQWCLADDSGLMVDALGGMPGVHSARYAAADAPPDAPRETIDRANNAKLLRELAGVEDEERTARFVCHLALADGETLLLEAEGRLEGRIGREPRGQNGFGYDPLFLLPQFGCTTAQLPPEEKNRISHRGRAVRDFAEKLKALLAERS